MTGIFLQVRINSNRLPRKALLELINGNVVQHAMRSLKFIKADLFALLTDEVSYAELEPFARAEGFEILSGPAEDVLKRYCMAARHFGVERVIRATGDNPLVSSVLGNKILRIHEEKAADLSHYLGIPIGSGIEVAEAAALFEAEAEAVDPFEREHLTTHLYRNRSRFRVIEESAPSGYYLPDARITLDTEEDYRLIKAIYNDLYDNKPIETDEIIQWFVKTKDGASDEKKDNLCS